MKQEQRTRLRWRGGGETMRGSDKKKSPLSRQGMECYVCCESGTDDLRAGLCECTDRWLHLRCQKKLLVTTSQDGRCTVCKASFRNVKCVVDRRLNVWWLVGQMGLGAMYCGMILSVVLLGMHLRNNTGAGEACFWARKHAVHNYTLDVIHHVCSESAVAVLLGNMSVLMLMIFCLTLSTLGVILIRRVLLRQPRVRRSRYWRTVDDASCTRAPESASPGEAST